MNPFDPLTTQVYQQFGDKVATALWWDVAVRIFLWSLSTTVLVFIACCIWKLVKSICRWLDAQSVKIEVDYQIRRESRSPAPPTSDDSRFKPGM